MKEFKQQIMKELVIDSLSSFDRIKNKVKAKGITLEALCKDIDYNVHTYKNIRRAKRSLPFDVIIRMSEYLDVSLNYLAYGQEENK